MLMDLTLVSHALGPKHLNISFMARPPGSLILHNLPKM